MQSPLVVDGAVKREELRSLPSLAGSDPVSAIIGSLSVRPAKDGTDVLGLTYRGKYPEDCTKILNAIIVSYEDFLGKTQRNISEETVQLITEAKDTLMKQLEEKEAAFGKFRERAPLLWNREEGTNPHAERLSSIESARTSLLIEQTQLKAQLQVVEEAFRKGGNFEALALMLKADLPSLSPKKTEAEVSAVTDTEGDTDDAENEAVDFAAMLAKAKMQYDLAIQDAEKAAAAVLFPLLLKREQMLIEYGPDHPKVKSHERIVDFARQNQQQLLAQQISVAQQVRQAKIVEIEAEKAKYEARVAARAEKKAQAMARAEDKAKAAAEAKKAEGEIEEPKELSPAEYLQAHLESLRKQLTITEMKEQELNSLFMKERDAAKQLAVFEVQEETHQKDIARTQQLFEGVIKRLEEINLVKDYGGYKAQVISPAGRAIQTEPDFNRIMTMSCMLGLLAGLALGYVVELSDKGFRGPDDVTAQLGTPVMAHIPSIHVDKKSAGKADLTVAAVLCTYHRPKSHLAEAYRSLRTALYFSARSEGHKVIQVTSPNPSDGKTTSVSNLAITIAQSGKKVLLIDADFRKPRIHRFFGLSNDVGFSNVVRGEAEIPDAVQESSISNLAIITCGPKPDNPSELLTSSEFQQSLDVFREEYDFILIDTPPLLVVSDPSVVAAQADGVLLTLRIDKRVGPNARRAVELLNSVDANLLGVVINRLGGSRGYGYGGYRYGYGYGNNYAYRYGYIYGRSGKGYYGYHEQSGDNHSDGKSTPAKTTSSKDQGTAT